MDVKYYGRIFPLPPGPMVESVICGILNFIIPGLGVFILSLNVHPYDPWIALVALLEFVLAFIAIGWVWAIIHGIIIIINAVRDAAHKDRERRAALPQQPGAPAQQMA